MLPPDFILYHRYEQLLIDVVRDWLDEVFYEAEQAAKKASGKNLSTRLDYRKGYKQYMESIHKDALYIRLIKSSSFAGHLTRYSQRVWTDMNGLEGLQAVTFIQRHYAYVDYVAKLWNKQNEPSPYNLNDLFGADPECEEEMEEQSFQITYQLCKILLNPRNEVYEMWTILRDEKDRQIGILSDEIDDLEYLIETA
mgnify:FL=1|tara:strand:- start:306 stop:893 length:588 start_codon:yes stop_codon:yes gene_type:complete